jgi:hypothetical protein
MAGPQVGWGAHDGPVVTHHVPHSAACHPTHGLNELEPAFCSDCDDLIAAASLAGVKAWIFGHHHWSRAVEVSGVPLVSAQPGYPGENTAWIGPGISNFRDNAKLWPLRPPAMAVSRADEVIE